MAGVNCIALVDDDATTNFLNKRMILKSGYAKQVVILKNGKEAIDYLSEEMDENHPRPNLILLDINMPIMNGFQFLDAYEALPETHKADQVVVLLSSSEQPLDKLEAEKRGVDTYIAKPLKATSIEKLIESYNA